MRHIEKLGWFTFPLEPLLENDKCLTIGGDLRRQWIAWIQGYQCSPESSLLIIWEGCCHMLVPTNIYFLVITRQCWAVEYWVVQFTSTFKICAPVKSHAMLPHMGSIQHRLCKFMSINTSMHVVQQKWNNVISNRFYLIIMDKQQRSPISCEGTKLVAIYCIPSIAFSHMLLHNRGWIHVPHFIHHTLPKCHLGSLPTNSHLLQ